MLSHVLIMSFFLVLVKQSQEEECSENFYIEDCSDDPENPTLYTQNNDFAFTAHYEAICHTGAVTYKWSRGSEVIERESSSIAIRANTLAPGSYNYTIEATIELNDGSKTLTVQCYLDMKKPGIWAVIKGGTDRTVIEGSDFIMDGTKSVDIDVTPNETGRLEYKWKCKVLEGSLKDFCRREYKGDTLKVPAKYAIANYIYFFTLEIKLEEMEEWKENANQTVRIESVLSKISIICEKNCPPKTQSQHLTYLRVTCLENCKGIRAASYEWTVEDVDFDYEKSTQFGRNTDKFIVVEGVFQPGTTYRISVTLIAKNVTATQQLEIYAAIKIESCQIHPTSGIATSTIFTVNCEYSGHGETFEVFTTKNEKSITLMKTRRIEDLKFRLPVDLDVFIKIEDDDHNFDKYKLQTDVSPRLPAAGNATEEIRTLIQQVENFTKEKSIDQAIQIASGLVEELDKKQSSEEIKEFKRTILKTFVETEITKQEEAQQVYALVSRIVYKPDAPSDPYQGAIATEACKKGARVDFSHLKSKHYAKKMAVEIKKNTKILMDCGLTDTKENFKNLKKNTLPFKITTPFPLVTHLVVEENYQDYDADDVAADKAKKYEETSVNYVEICKTTLKMMALTVVEGEDTVISVSENVSVQVTKLIGSELVAKEIAIEGASFRASADLAEVSGGIDVMVCCWEKDPFWWNPSGRTVFTNVVLVQLRKEEELLTKFEQPFRLSLNVKEQHGLAIREFEGGNMSVIKIGVKAGEAFFIKFHGSCDSCGILATDFYKPEEEEVRRRGHIVTSDESEFYQPHDHDYDGWHYLSVISKSNFQVSVHTMSCYSWNAEKISWAFACKSTSNSSASRIVCSCNHLSILAGVIYNNPIKLDRVTTEPELEMILLSSPLIFICVATTFSIYCILSPIVLKQNLEKTISVYIPSDISRYAKYAYVVVVRTGWKLAAGTSSTICLRVFGSNSKSQSHVLNYPDPQKRILQRGNEDFFVLLTSFHLGNLTEIALWSNHSGRDPRWFCEDVAIYDLQQRQKSYFLVNRWLDLPPKGEISVKVGVSEEVKKKKRFERVFQRDGQDMNLFGKFTFVLSGTLSIFHFCLVLWGLPRLALRDGFAIFEKIKIYPQIFSYGTASAASAFVLHVGLRLLVRKKSTICWYLLMLNIVGGMAVLLVHGWWLPTTTGWLWLLSVVFALAIYFLVLRNIYTLVWTLLQKKRASTDWMTHFKKIVSVVQEQRTYLFKKFGGDLLRPYFASLYQPMTREDIEEKKVHVQTRSGILTLIEDTVMFTCYITLLYLAIFVNKNPLQVLSHKEMVALLNLRQNSIQSIDDIYNYINSSLIPTLHITHWYGKYVVKEPATMSDFTNKFLGVARLRQKRAQLSDCHVPPILSFLNFTYCRPEFWFAKENRQRRRDFNEMSHYSQIWSYSTTKSADFAVILGKFGFYSSGGFLATLGRTMYNSYVELNYFSENKWMDNSTVLVLIEFLAYNVNTNLFNAARCIFEISSTGFIQAEVDVSTVQLLFVRDEDSVAQLVIMNAFGLVLLIFSLKLMSKLWKGKFLVLQDWWILVDLTIVGMSYGSVVLFVQRADLVKEFLNKLETSKKNEFINYFHLLYVEKITTLVAALLVFISTIRLWKLCRFGTIFRIMEKTLVLSRVPLLAMVFSHVVLVLAFSLSGHIIFGRRSKDFQSILESLVSLMRLSTRQLSYFDVDDLINPNPILGNVFFTAYMFFNLSFHTLYICIIILRYYQAQQIVLAQNDFQDLKAFLAKEFGYYRTSLKLTLSRLKGGTTSRKPKVTPKGNEFRYANCAILSSKVLEMMCCIAWYDLKKYRLGRQKKAELMARVVRCCLGDGTDEIFFTQKSGRTIKVVPDDKMKKIAAATELILSYDAKRRQRRERRYRTVMNNQLRKLDYIKEVLSTVLHIVENIDVDGK